MIKMTLLRALSISLIATNFISCSSPQRMEKELTKSSGSEKRTSTKETIFRSAGSFQMRPYKQVVLDNGLKLYFIRDTSLPRLSFTLLVRTGTLQEPKALAGLNALTANLLEQGTQTRSAIALADELGGLGTALDVEATADFTTIYADALTTGADGLLNVFADITMNPAFKDAEIGRLKSQMIAALKKRVDDPSRYADSRMDAFLYGEHPYSRDVLGEVATLNKIRKQDIIRHYLSFYKPNNSSLAVVGNFTDEYERSVESAFARWTKRKTPEVTWAAPPATESVQVKLIVKKGLQQTQIRVSSLGVARRDERFLPLRMSNETLGGGFASRLNQKVRDDLGLTYSIYSSFDARKDRGSFDISTFTKNESAGKTLEETLNVLQEYVKSGATGPETSAARNQLIGQFPRVIETADRLAFNLMVLEWMGVPADYLSNFIKNVGRIKSQEAHEALLGIVDPTKIKILVYGDEKIVPQFEKWKPVIERH